MYEKKSPRHKENQLNTLPLALTYAVVSAVLMIGALSLPTLIQITEKKEGLIISVDYEPQKDAILIRPNLGVDGTLIMSVDGVGNIVFSRGELSETRVTVEDMGRAKWEYLSQTRGSLVCESNKNSTDKRIILKCK